MQMKKTVFRKLNFLIAIGGIFAALALGGCENLLSSTSSSDDSAPVNFIPPAGNVENGYGIIHGILPQETSASTRSAIPDVPTISSYKVFAQNGITTIEANVDSASKTFSISLPYGTWNVTANGLLANGRVVYTQTQKNIAVSAANPTVELKFNLSYSTNPEDGEGTISLTVKFPASGAASTIAGIECTLTKGGSKITVPVSQADLQAGTFKIEHITEDLGTYSLTIQCYGNSANLAYRIDEIVNVYANLTTDKFVGSAPYISAGEINITQAMLDEFQQTTLYVNATSGDDNNTGTQFDPLRTFNRAVELVNNSTRPPATEFRIFLQSDVVDGAELELNAGKKLTVASAGNTSTITSLGRAFTVAATSELTVKSVQFQKLRFVVEGTFAMNEGKISGNELDGNGGAIYIKAGGEATITGGEISNNKATLSGGGIYNEGGTLEISGGTKIIDCTSGSIGGGIHNDDASATATITDCDITGCTSTTGGGSIGNAYGTLTVTRGNIERSSARVGGGIWNASNGTLIIDGTTITDCEAKHQGGGIYTSGNSPNKIKNCNITSCTVSETASGNGGGGIYIYKNGTLEITGGTIERCTAPHNGGGIYNAGGTAGAPVAITGVTIERCTTSGTSDYHFGGGGIYNNAGTLKLSGVTITGGGDIDNPDAYYGGGIYNVENGTLTIDGGAITGCGAERQGGGIYNEGTLTVENGTKIFGCKCDSWGGGIGNSGSSATATITDCTVEQCSTSSASSNVGGGGISNYKGTLTITDGKIIDCTAEQCRGGGVWNTGTLTVTGGTITNCTAEQGYGGGICSTESTSVFTATGVTVSKCTAKGGGGIYTFSSSALIDSCTITGCKALGTGNNYGGGGIRTGGDGVTIKNCTIGGSGPDDGNTADYGGGLVNYGTLTIEGGEISGNTASTNGGGIQYRWISGTKCDITLDGVTISGNSAANVGGGIYIPNDSGTLTMKAGTTISGNTATKSGGGVYVSSGTLAMEGGTISDNIANESGGGVYAYNSTFTMNDGTISGNISRGTTEGSFGGGGIFIYHSTASANGGVFTMTGGTVSGNEAVYGGGIWGSNFSEISLEGGTFSGNTAATSGQGAYVSPGCTFKMSGAASLVSNNGDNDVYLHGVKNSSTGAVMSYATITVAGALTATSPVATITPAIYEADQAVLSADTGLTITPTICSSFAMSSAPAGMAELGIAPDGTGTKGILRQSTFYVRGTGAGWYAENPAYIAAAGNDTTGNGSKDKPFATIQKAIETAFAINDGASEYTIWVDGTITGGATATANGMADISPTKALNLKIQSMSATTNATLDAEGSGRVLNINANAAVALKNVNIANGSVADAGGGINNDGTLTMEGGTISNCESNAASPKGGGGIHNLGTLTLDGVTISNCTTDGAGGAVWNDILGTNISTLTITGGTIENCTANAAGAIYNAGALTVESGTTISGCTANLGGGIWSHVTDTSVTSTVTDCTITGCKATGSGSGGGIYNSKGTLTLSGVTITGGNSAASPDATEGGGIYNSAGCALTIKDSTTISACVARTAGGGVWNAGTLILESGEINGNEAKGGGGGVYVNGGSFTMTGGTISSNTATTDETATPNGGGVCFESGSFTMSGGEISDNTAKGAGGGVYFKGTAFTMSGTAKISGNKVTYASGGHGGGVSLKSGTFTIEGGEISGNTSTGTGGGVYSSDTLIMKGGTVSTNTATTDGGGVYVNSGTFNMNGGTITNNNAIRGGGVHNSGTFTIKDGTISGNKATGIGVYAYGGGVWNAGTLTMQSGAKIENNIVSDGYGSGSGGGVYNHNGGAFTMTGGTISGNTVRMDGGGIFVNEGVTFRITGGTISGNTARYGGGISSCGASTMTMTGGTISDNHAAGHSYSSGGGIYMFKGSFSMIGGTISGNDATGTRPESGGGGIFIGENGSCFVMSGGTFSGNTAQNGNGAFVAEGGTMEMGSSARFASDDDVYLYDNTTTTAVPTIQIVNALTGTTPVATITPSAYAIGKQVLSAGAGITITQAICDKFAVSDDENWKLAPDSTGAYGVLNKDTFYVRGTGVGWYTEHSEFTAAAGNDTTGDGSKAKPFLSLQQAIDSVTAMNDGTSEYTIYVDGTIKQKVSGAGHVGMINPRTSLKLKIESMSATTNATLDGESVNGVRGLYIANTAVEVTLINVNIKNCYYPAGGGGVFVSGSTVTITGGTISNCHMVSSSTSYGGGAIFINYGSLTVSHTTISDCTSTTLGGAIYMYSGNTTLNDVTISNCSATNSGGGIYNHNGAELTVTGGSIEGCTTSSTDANTGGGGIYNAGSGTVEITGAKISSCTAQRTGGGIYNFGTLRVSGTDFTQCKTISNSGGGICNSSGATATVTNCSFTNCEAALQGGGIRNAGTLTISGVTYTGCTATTGGPDIYNVGTITP